MYENGEQSFDGAQNLLSLIELIYDASDKASLWPVVLDRIAEAVDGDQIALFSNSADAAAPNVSSLARMAPKDLAPYTAYYKSTRVHTERCQAPFPAGTVRYSPPAAPGTEFDSSEICGDCRIPHGMYCRFGLKVPVSDRPVAYLTCMRPRQRGHFDEREGAIFKTLLPHLQRSLRHYVQSEQAKSEIKNLKSVVDMFDRAVIGLSGEGIVVLLNREAERIIEIGNGLKLVRGRLVAVSSSENAKLQSQIAKAVENGLMQNTAQSTALLLSRPSDQVPLQLAITPFESNLKSNNGQVAALVYINDPAKLPNSCGTLLRQLYGLSPAECRLADMLHQGLEVREAAYRAKNTLETARFHLKKVLAKTGTRRQSELIRLMMTLPRIA
jgi:DNA-binding CsgD family transcriptional regulator